MAGKLLIVGTPIGNLGDFPPRAVEALKSADLVLCEDTRHTQTLLTRFSIQTRSESFHEHNEDARAATIIARIEEGATIALVSDAGMPLISDPGYPLVRLAREKGITVEPIPGPFAGVVALAASGLAPLPFTFLGFAPHRQGERREFYLSMAALGHTAIVYESPERLIGSLEDVRDTIGDVEISVARELTKIHEEIVNGTVSEVLAQFVSRRTVQGEITIVFAAPGKRAAASSSSAEVIADFERLRSEGMRRNDAVKVVAESHGLRRNDVYRLLLGQSESGSDSDSGDANG